MFVSGQCGSVGSVDIVRRSVAGRQASVSQPQLVGGNNITGGWPTDQYSALLYYCTLYKPALWKKSHFYSALQSFPVRCVAME